uniref:Outer dense fiber protein 3-like protein 2 n=1 Tax=Heliothis virescens TaxID=7102 RepID=A0A2A4J5F3_HELVI
MSKKPLGPGPGAYQLPTTVGFTQHDPSRYRNPMYSFGTNAGYRLRGLGPGPAYRIERRCPPMREPRAPVYSMGARLGFALKRPGPAPNAYALRLGPGTPAYTMGARVGFMPKANATPTSTSASEWRDACGTAPLARTLTRDCAGSRLLRASPAAPGERRPHTMFTLQNPYSYSFGTKHGDYAPPMIIKEDTMDCL